MPREIGKNPEDGETIQFKARFKGKTAKGTIVVFGPKICSKNWNWKAKLRR